MKEGALTFSVDVQTRSKYRKTWDFLQRSVFLMNSCCLYSATGNAIQPRSFLCNEARRSRSKTWPLAWVGLLVFKVSGRVCFKNSKNYCLADVCSSLWHKITWKAYLQLFLSCGFLYTAQYTSRDGKDVFKATFFFLGGGVVSFYFDLVFKETFSLKYVLACDLELNVYS